MARLGRGAPLQIRDIRPAVFVAVPVVIAAPSPFSLTITSNAGDVTSTVRRGGGCLKWRIVMLQGDVLGAV